MCVCVSLGSLGFIRAPGPALGLPFPGSKGRGPPSPAVTRLVRNVHCVVPRLSRVKRMLQISHLWMLLEGHCLRD